MNILYMSGNIVKTPELGESTAGKKYTKFSLAVPRFAGSTSENNPTDYFDVIAFEKVAEAICKWTQKGSRIGLQGKVVTNTWTTEEGKKRVKVEIRADSVEFYTLKENAQPARTKDRDIDSLPTVDDDDMPF